LTYQGVSVFNMQPEKSLEYWVHTLLQWSIKNWFRWLDKFSFRDPVERVWIPLKTCSCQQTTLAREGRRTLGQVNVSSFPAELCHSIVIGISVEMQLCILLFEKKNPRMVIYSFIVFGLW